MKRNVLLLLTIIGAINLQSCTADSIQEIEAEMEVYASDGKETPHDPKDLPDDDEEGDN